MCVGPVTAAGVGALGKAIGLGSFVGHGTGLASAAAFAANAALIASPLYSGYQAYQAANAEQQQTQYKAANARREQQVYDYKAQDALDRGREEEQKRRREARQFKGKQRSMLAAQGRELDSGSALDTLQDTDMMGDLDAFAIRKNAQREAWQHRVSAGTKGAQAGLYDTQAANISPKRSAANSILGDAKRFAFG